MSEFRRFTAPGLPTWPPLLWDQQRMQAVVTARFATWKSGVIAQQACVLSAWSLNLFVAGWLWQQAEGIENPVPRGALALLGACVTASVTKLLIPAAFQDFLARKVFARRVTVWMTPQTIAFRSPVYENGVAVPRSWQRHPLQIRFDLAMDPEAVVEQSRSPGKPGWSPSPQSARILRLVMAAFDPQRHVAQSTHSPLARAIPMLPLDLQDAQQLTVVLAAAAELTAHVPLPSAHTVFSPNAGLDIDAHST